MWNAAIFFPSEYKGQNNRVTGRTPQPLGCKGQVEFEEWRGRRHKSLLLQNTLTLPVTQVPLPRALLAACSLQQQAFKCKNWYEKSHFRSFSPYFFFLFSAPWFGYVA